MRLCKGLFALAVCGALAACAGTEVAGTGNTATYGPPAVQSAEATIAEHRLRLRPPPDYCALDRAQLQDALVLHLLDKAVEGAAQVLSIWRDCAALAASRRGVRDFARPAVAVAAALEDGRPLRLPMSRQMLLDLLASTYPELADNDALSAQIDEEVRRRFDDTIGRFARNSGVRMEMGETTNLGFKARDANAAYLAFISRARSGDAQIVLGNIVAVTQVNGLLLQVAVFADLEDESTIDRLLAEAQAILARLVADNDRIFGTEV